MVLEKLIKELTNTAEPAAKVTTTEPAAKETTTVSTAKETTTEPVIKLVEVRSMSIWMLTKDGGDGGDGVKPVDAT